MFFISCNGSSSSPAGVGALYDDHTEQFENPNESDSDCQILIDDYENEIDVLKCKIADLEEEIKMINSELEDQEINNQLKYIDDIEVE